MSDIRTGPTTPEYEAGWERIFGKKHKKYGTESMKLYAPMPDICPICGTGKLEKKTITETFSYKGQSLVIGDYVVHSCPVCGEVIVDQETLKTSGEMLKEFKKLVDDNCGG